MITTEELETRVETAKYICESEAQDCERCPYYSEKNRDLNCMDHLNYDQNFLIDGIHGTMPHSYWVDEYQNHVVLDENGCTQSSCSCHRCGSWLTASDEYACKGIYCPNCGAKMDSSPLPNPVARSYVAPRHRGAS